MLVTFIPKRLTINNLGITFVPLLTKRETTTYDLSLYNLTFTNSE